MMRSVLLAAFAVISFSTASYAGQGLVIHASEFGVGKFHRYDNQVHQYDGASAWKPFIIASSANQSSGTLVVDNADGSVSIFYATLEEMLASVAQVAQKRGTQVSVLNVHGHGLPGAMWFPATKAMLNSSDCSDWVKAASGPDKDNYDQYYSPVADFEIQQIRDISNTPGFKMGCTTGLDEWKAVVAANPAILAAFADGAQLHFLSCVVGLGSVGDTFTKGIADLLFSGKHGTVQTSTNFGLGDWSMDEGMGFWDWISDAQLDHDNTIYPKDRKDREIMQKGTIRVATIGTAGAASNLVANRDFMALSYETAVRGTPVVETFAAPASSVAPRIRVPGTSVYVPVR